MGAVDWGDVPTWLGGVFAAFAAYGAIATMKSQRQQIDEQRQFIRIQTALLELDHRDRTWAQALGVRVSAAEIKSGRKRWWRVVVRNRSSGPIFDVDVTFGAERPDTRSDGNITLTTQLVRAYTFRPFIPNHAPDLRVRLEPGGALAATSENWHSDGPRKEEPTVEFTDAAHVRWRLKSGELTKLGPVTD
ncbi:hypothetical protein [Streptomyces sp. NPDC001165]|uniref:hypothetical protein n=1 Tax=Streptomyces sp. NPDC001165 TaxID=3364546 RepID=UPI0036978AE1